MADEATYRALREASDRQRREARLDRRVEIYLALMWCHVLEALTRRPGASSALVWLTIGALAWLDAARPVVTVPHEAAWIGVVISAIAQVFGYIAGHAVTIVVTLAQAAIMIGQAIAQFAVAIATIFSKVYGLLANFWSGTLRPFVEWAWKQFDRFVGWLDRTLGPVIKFLEEIRRQVDKFYNRWFKPLFDAIDATRRVMQILARLHVPFAKELDTYLGYLEAKLLAPIQYLYYRLNQVMDWVNRIITLDGYLQQLTLIRSLWKYQRAALSVWWESIHRPLTGARQDVYRSPLVTRSMPAIRADLVAYVFTGSGPDRARIDEHALDLAIRLRSA